MPSPREVVLDFVKELVELSLPNLHICITSRPEIDIRTVIEPLTTHRVSLHDETGQKKDIVEYVSSAVREDVRMGKWREKDQKLVIETLSERADGMCVSFSEYSSCSPTSPQVSMGILSTSVGWHARPNRKYVTARSIIIGELQFFFAQRGLNGCLGHTCRELLKPKK